MNQTNERIYQAVVILKDTPQDVVAKELVRGTQVLLAQYTPGKASNLGKFETKQFQETYQKWVDENEGNIRVFIADDRLELDSIEYQAVSLETVPASGYGEGESVLVLGPFDGTRLDFHLQNCTEV
ncbi:hypothetical protein SEPL_200 [Salmonella phage SE_PL]|uniref:hypothetical protein n=1 Tax=Salmonella enterica TaxID=28901 RepID=UPI000FDF71D6|nr:hypothetical protein CPT_Munch_227 [Salmonella phage Munch]EAZ2023011.1 hypothetical protein [Salmonella enterica]ECV9084147.1 hypothetical protein [Salmonella enterica subsp. enterica serovar Infantis]MCP0435751.1 hypothetical protein [Salmonella enterica subsp. enterica serovar Mbandaka]QCW18914.1 hypothetical protein 7t3_0393 [Salmonella phage 7t3]QIG62813.1 hypothetical protein SEPL_200 [Salmonella phage SE_PL]WNV47333.1 hypothetical protein [Klebsiella phage fENko-Kae01]